jgi:hypothetical protein
LWGEGDVARPQPMSTAVYRSINKLWRSDSIFNLHMTQKPSKCGTKSIGPTTDGLIEKREIYRKTAIRGIFYKFLTVTKFNKITMSRATTLKILDTRWRKLK